MSQNQPGTTELDEQAAEWCLLLADEDLSVDDQRAFDAWILEPAHARAFDEAVRVWSWAGETAETPELIRIRASALDSYRRAHRHRWAHRTIGRWQWAAGAFAAALLLVLSVVLLSDPVQGYATGIGERRVVALADGSHLSLDADTEVQVRMERHRRVLTLVRGRAKFDVAKDPLRPFSVAAGDRLVIATGTSFSVELLAQQVHVVLYEGRVAVLKGAETAAAPEQVRSGAGLVTAERALAPGGRLVVAIDGTAPAIVAPVADPGRSLSWEGGQISFDDEPLSSAVERVNRYSREKLAVGDARAAGIRIDGVFTAGDVRAFVEGVTALHDVEARERDGRLVFVGK